MPKISQEKPRALVIGQPCYSGHFSQQRADFFILAHDIKLVLIYILPFYLISFLTNIIISLSIIPLSLSHKSFLYTV